MTTRPKVFLLASTPEFDFHEIANLCAEGYDIKYIAEPSVRDIEHAADDLESHEKYCIIAFGTAATFALEFATSPVRQLAAVIAYYPTGLPVEDYKSNTTVLLHLTDVHSFGPPAGTKFRIYYNTKPGFAEPGNVNYDAVNASVAYSRTLAVLRSTVGPLVDLEDIWEDHINYEFVQRNVDKTMATMVDEPYVNHIPTMTGGFGYTQLRRFYADFFIPNNPPSLRLQLVSRTVGSDRVVDEMAVSFRHTCEIPWMLPGVVPTDKEVEVALVSIICIRGGLLYHEHIYWDQASVLVQIGLIDGSKLPVVGAQGVRKVLDIKSEPSNKLIPGWKTTQ